MRMNPNLKLTLYSLFLFLLIAAAAAPLDNFFVFVVSTCVVGMLIIKSYLGKWLLFSIPSLPSMFLISFIALIVLPSIYIYICESDSARYAYLVAFISPLVTFPFGVLLASLLQVSKADPRAFITSALNPSALDMRLMPVVILLLLLSMPYLYVYYSIVPFVQLFEIMKPGGSNVDPLQFRYANRNAPFIVVGLFELFRRIILPLCTVYIHGVSRIYGGGYRPLFVCVFLYSLFFAALTLDRAPIFAMVIVLMFSKLLLDGFKTFDLIKPKIIVLIAAAILVGGVVTGLQKWSSSFSAEQLKAYVIGFLSSRVFLNPSEISWTNYRQWYHSYEFLGGKSIRLLAPLMGLEYEPLGPASFIADLWRNFAWPGIILGPIVLGAFLQILQQSFFPRKTIFRTMLFIILGLNSAWLIYGNALGTVPIFVFLSCMCLHYFMAHADTEDRSSKPSQTTGYASRPFLTASRPKGSA